MNELRIPITLIAIAALSYSCETDDPRVRLPAGSQPADEGPGDDPSPRGLAELCGEDTPDCADGLSCYQGVCIPTPYAEACTPNPCGDRGLCNARGPLDEDGNIAEGDLLVICRCPAADEEWDGSTCRASASAEGYPSFTGSVLEEGESCPGPEAQPDVPGATDCPGDSFCDAAAAGSCLEYNLSVVGTLDGRDIDVGATGSDGTTVECTRKYLEAEGDEDTDRVSDGVTLVITGTLAEQISPGATSITIDTSGGDVLDGEPLLVLPADNPAESRGDSVTASLTVDDADLSVLGGRLTIDSASGPDDDEDGLIDDDEGAIGGTFFLGLSGDQYLAGAFVVRCGENQEVR